jgi:hypothetical protein
MPDGNLGGVVLNKLFQTLSVVQKVFQFYLQPENMPQPAKIT